MRRESPVKGTGAVWPWVSSCKHLCVFSGNVALHSLLAAAVRGVSYKDCSQFNSAQMGASSSV